jgi:tetratricopeptide (TPR) repeat protein
LKGVFYLLTLLAALRIARSKDGVTFLSGTVVVTALLLAAAALLHPAFGLHKVFGIYTPQSPIHDRHIAPLLNANNLAGYLNVALCLSLAPTLSREPRLPRSVTGAAAVVLIATQVWVASRGGIIAMLLGVLLVTAIWWRTRTARRFGLTPILIAFVTLAAAVLLVVASSNGISGELLDPGTSKLNIARQALRIVHATPWFGCGRGAFESVFPAFRTTGGYYTYSYPENVLVQWLSEWGIPVGTFGLVVGLVALRPNAVLARSTTAGGAWAALIALGIQNLADLGTEIPGLVVAGVVCAAIVVGGTAGDLPRSRIHRWANSPQRVAWSACVMAIVGIVIGASAAPTALHDDEKRLANAALAGRASAAEMRGLARAAMLRHPAEPYIPFIVGLRASDSTDDNPLPWLEAALERAAIYGQAHLVLGRVFARNFPSQARLEFRLAIEQGMDLLPYVLADAMHLVGEYDDAMQIVPPGPDGAKVLQQVIPDIPASLPATRVRLDAQYSSLDPSARAPKIDAATNAVDDIEANTRAEWCDDGEFAGCVGLALTLTERVRTDEPDRCTGYVLLARIRMADSRVSDGLAELQEAADHVTDRVSCLEQLVTLSRRAGDESRAEAALDRLLGAGCGDKAECAENASWAARDEEAHGNLRKALALYRRAYDRAPSDNLLEQIAALASRAALHAESAADYEILMRRQPDVTRWREAVAREREAAIRGSASE